MITKYNTKWVTSLGKGYVLEEMTTNHLLNCYQHVKNNIQHYYNLQSARMGGREAGWEDVMTTIKELKQELLSRNIKESKIENWQEETWKIGQVCNDYITGDC